MKNNQFVFAVAVAFCLVGCAPTDKGPTATGGSATNPPQNAQPVADRPPAKDKPPVIDHPFGEEVSAGDLRISVKEVISGEYIRSVWFEFGQNTIYGGKFTYAHLVVRNVSPVKVVDWPGQPTANGIDAEDEHGNKFKRQNLTGYRKQVVVDIDPWQQHDADFTARLLPGQTDESAMFYQFAPPTSKQAAISIQVGDHVIRFRGPVGSNESLDHDAALKAKAGQILDAGDLLKDLAAGSKTIATDYPTGCAIRATGVVQGTPGRNPDGPSLIRLAYPNTGPTAWETSYTPTCVLCYTSDNALIDMAKGGEKLSLQGVLTRAGPSRQATLSDCVKVK